MSSSAGRLVLVLAGAALASMVLIFFINAEAASRKGHKDPEIANGNLFSAAGHRVKRMIRDWVADDEDTDKNKFTTTDKEHSAASAEEMKAARKPSRKLAEWTETTHGVRHGHHRDRHPAAPTAPTAPTAAPGRPRDDLDDVAPLNASSANGGGGRAANQAHDRCYDTTDVLYVIAVTCVINFAFVLFIMTWVRISTAHAKITYSDAVPGGEWQSKRRRSTSRLCPSDSYSSVQEYVNSLPDAPYAPYASYAPSPATTTSRGAARYQRRTFSMEDLLFV